MLCDAFRLRTHTRSRAQAKERWRKAFENSNIEAEPRLPEIVSTCNSRLEDDAQPVEQMDGRYMFRQIS